MPRAPRQSPQPIVRSAQAYGYPLLLKQLLHTPMTQSAEQQIVYRHTVRHTYRELHQRFTRLAQALVRAKTARHVGMHAQVGLGRVRGGHARERRLARALGHKIDGAAHIARRW